MKKQEYKKPIIRVIVSEPPTLLSASQSPYGNAKENRFDDNYWDDTDDEYDAETSPTTTGW